MASGRIGKADRAGGPDGPEPQASQPKALIPCAWEAFEDHSYFGYWCVRPVGERQFGCGFHLAHEQEANGLAELLTASAVPNPWSAA